MTNKEYTAILTIIDLPSYTNKQKKELATWLMEKSEEILSCNPSDYAKIYRLRLCK